MRRAVATGMVIAALVVASACQGSSHLVSDGSGQVGILRATKVEACRQTGDQLVAAMLGDTNVLPQDARLKPLRAQLAKLPKQKRADEIRTVANAAIVMCAQTRHGVAWSPTALGVYFIPSESMVPTLKVGDHVLVNKLGFKVAAPERGDIAVFRAPPGVATAEISELVKRIVGLPGETIEGRDGRILIDGRPIDEPYLRPSARSRTFGPELIPDDRYYMLGDNRQYSKDSTFFGPIAGAALVGPATKL